MGSFSGTINLIGLRKSRVTPTFFGDQLKLCFNSEVRNLWTRSLAALTPKSTQEPRELLVETHVFVTCVSPENVPCICSLFTISA